MRHALLRRHIALATVLLWMTTSACQKWVPLETAPPVAEQVESGDELRVYSSDGGQTRLSRDVDLTADSLVGFTARGQVDAPSRRIAIPLEDIERIEARKAKPLATVGLVAGGGLLIASIIAMATGGSLEDADTFF